jgi:hypothetical protein
MSQKKSPVTVPTGIDVEGFLGTLEDEQKRQDSITLRDLMASTTGEEARMWGSSIIGFGSYHYRYESGHEGDAPAVSFSPRKANLTLYITGGFEEHEDTLARLGKHKLGKGCLYIKRLADVDKDVLRELIRKSAANAARFHVEP